MDKDFPRYLFPFVRDNNKSPADEKLSGWSASKLSAAAEQDDSSRDQYGICEKIIKLNYSYPVRIDFDADGESKIRCLTHKYHSSDFLRPVSPVMPWRLYSNDLRPKAGLSYFHVLSLSSISQKLFEQVNLATSSDLDEMSEADHRSTDHIVLPKIEQDAGDLEEAPFFYFVICNSIRAKFFPGLFARGNKGKCIYTSEGLWMTPLQFKCYCGSNAADWRHVLRLVKPTSVDTTRRKEKKTTLKTMIDQDKLTIHQPACLCALCTENDFVQSQNLQLLSTFFLNSHKELYTVTPNMKNSSHLDVNVFVKASRSDSSKSIYDFLEKVNYQLLSHGRPDPSPAKRGLKSWSRTIKWTDPAGQVDPAHYAIKQIVARTFEEGPEEANEVYDSFVSVNLNDSKLTTLHLESLLSDSSDELDACQLQIKPMYSVQFPSPFRVKAMAASPMIRGECAFLLDDIYDLYLANEENACVRFDTSANRLAKVATNLGPLFETTDLATCSGRHWRHVDFGTHPRSLIYADYSQLVSIDSRIKTVGSRMARELFRPSAKWLDIDELICRASVVQSDSNMHLVCCSKTLLLLDERFPGRPLISWKHHLDSSAIFLNSVSLPSASSPERPVHLAILSDARDVYMHQFSTKLFETPLSHNFVRRLSSPVDLIDALPADYDRRLHRNLKYRLEAPIISLSTLQYHNSFALFQMLDKQDVYYECFQVDRTETPQLETSDLLARTKKGAKILNKWIDQVKSQSFKRTAIDLEADFEEMNLNQSEEFERLKQTQIFPRPHHLCRICSNLALTTGEVKPELSDYEDCPRCGHSISFAKNLMNSQFSPNMPNCATDNLNSNLSLFEMDDQAKESLLNDNFTQSIYEIWK